MSLVMCCHSVSWNFFVLLQLLSLLVFSRVRCDPLSSLNALKARLECPNLIQVWFWERTVLHTHFADCCKCSGISPSLSDIQWMCSSTITKAYIDETVTVLGPGSYEYIYVLLYYISVHLYNISMYFYIHVIVYTWLCFYFICVCNHAYIIYSTLFYAGRLCYLSVLWMSVCVSFCIFICLSLFVGQSVCLHVLCQSP